MENTYVNYDEENVAEPTLSQKVAANLIGRIAGIGAATIVSTAAAAIVIGTKSGKLIKAISFVGASAMGVMVGSKVDDYTTESLKEMFTAINGLKASFSKISE